MSIQTFKVPVPSETAIFCNAEASRVNFVVLHVLPDPFRLPTLTPPKPFEVPTLITSISLGFEPPSPPFTSTSQASISSVAPRIVSGPVVVKSTVCVQPQSSV